MMALTRPRAEAWAYMVLMVTMCAVVVLVVAPTLVLMIVGIIMGTVPFDSELGIFGSTDDYPLFVPPRSLIAVPAVGIAFLALWTFPLPLTGSVSNKRWHYSLMTFMAFALSFASLAAFDDASRALTTDQWVGGAAVLVMFCAWLLVVLRQILGWLRLLPRSWRVPVGRRGRARRRLRADNGDDRAVQA